MSDHSTAALALSDNFLKAGNLSMAEDVLTTAERNDPENVDIIVRHAYIANLRNNPFQALALFNRAREMNPNKTEVYLGIALIHYKNRKDKEAERFLNEAILIAEENDEQLMAHIACAHLAMLRSDYDTILDLFPYHSEMVEVDSNLGYVFAQAFMKKGDMPVAEALCENLVSGFPSDSSLYLLLGRIRVYQGRIQEAIRLFDQAIELSPHALDMYDYPVRLLLRNRQWIPAFRLIRKAFRNNAS